MFGKPLSIAESSPHRQSCGHSRKADKRAKLKAKHATWCKSKLSKLCQRRVQLKSFPTNVSKPYTTWLVSRTCKWSSMFLMTRTYLFESFDIFLIASNLIKSEELAWPLWPVYFRDIFEPSVLTPRSKEAPAHNWRWLQWNVPFRLQGSHVSVCTSAMRQQSSPKNEVLHEPASVMTWTCSPLAFYTYIYIIIYIYYPKIVSWCACGHLTPILITIYMEWYESNLFQM